MIRDPRHKADTEKEWNTLAAEANKWDSSRINALIAAINDATGKEKDNITLVADAYLELHKMMKEVSNV